MPPRERTNLTVALDPKLRQQLQARCAALDVPLGIYVRTMLRQHFDQLEQATPGATR